MRILKTAVRRWNDFLLNSYVISRLIHAQHKLWPMPLAMFDLLFRFSFCRRFFNFYGSNIANLSYLQRGSNQLKFWLSKESLYWHFWRQTDTNDQIFQEIFSFEPIKKLLRGNEGGVVVEFGFGLGKNYGKFLRHNKFEKYIAVEPNVHLCNYVAKKFKADKNLEIINVSVADFIRQRRSFDVLFCSGGVFMYLNREFVDEFFQSIRSAGVKTVIILNEGTPKQDIVRDDGTAMFNFKNRLISAGYGYKKFIEKQKEGDIYSYFIMY